MFGSKNIGDILLDAGLITEFQLRTGLNEQKRWGCKLGEALLRLGFITEEIFVWALCQQLKVPAIDLKKIEIPKKVIEIYPKKLLLRLRALPIGFKKLDDREFLAVAMADPTNLQSIDELNFASPHTILPVLAGPNTLDRALKFYLEYQDNAIDLTESQTSTYEFRMTLDKAEGHRTLTEHAFEQEQEQKNLPITFSNDFTDGFSVQDLMSQSKAQSKPQSKPQSQPVSKPAPVVENPKPEPKASSLMLASEVLPLPEPGEPLQFPKSMVTKEIKPVKPVVPVQNATPPVIPPAPVQTPRAPAAPPQAPIQAPMPSNNATIANAREGINLFHMRDEVNAIWRVLLQSGLIDQNQIVAIVKGIRNKK